MTRFKDGVPGPIDVNISSVTQTGDAISEFDSSSVSSHPSTRVTHTVSTDKLLRVFSWHFETESAIGKVELQVAGTAVDSIRFSNSSDTTRIQVDFGNGPVEATAGQVVRIQSIAGDTGKEFTVGFTGVEVDA